MGTRRLRADPFPRPCNSTFHKLLSLSLSLFSLFKKKKYFSAEGIRPCNPLERSASQWSMPRFNFSDGFERCLLMPTAPDRLPLPESPGDIRGFPPRGTNRALNRARACAGSNRHLLHPRKWRTRAPVFNRGSGGGARGILESRN